MVSGPRLLSPGRARRSKLCAATRLERRDIARNRCRRPLQSIDNVVHLNVASRQSSGNAMEQGQHENNENVIGQIHRENQDIIIDQIHCDREDEVEHVRNNVHPSIFDNVTLRPVISYLEGDFKQVEKYCLSVNETYSQCPSSISPSMAPLYFGKCLLHNLGDLSHACSFCEAMCWKSEGKSIRNFVGKFCCLSGKVILLRLDDPPAELKCLLQDNTSRSKSFRQNIRAYNSALAFASLGAHIDNNFSRGRGVYTFKVHGSVYHNIGPLMPSNDHGRVVPRFAQLYFFDTDHELDNRLHHIPDLDKNILEMLQNMMHHCNPYARAFRSAAIMMQTSNVPEVRMIINENRSNGWQYLAPRGSEVAAIMPGQGDEYNLGHRDILIDFQDGGIKRISSLHRSYMSLLYVLLFPWGEDGWYPQLRNTENNGKFVTQKQYYTFRLQVRIDTVECLLRGGRLLQQFIVDAYSTMEESRLFWLRNNQRTLRAEVYQGLADMIVARDGNETRMGIEAGRRVILPSSFTGGPRYMMQLYQDAMAIVRSKGKPDLFITFTCNPQWKEIKNALLPGQTTSDRPDLTSRVFYQKFRDMMHLLLKGAVFGDVVGHVSVIEFQKRGLPHAHILLILASEHKPSELCHYDKLVCAEFPNKEVFPDLYDIIRRCNVHGPCGQFKPDSSCMVDGMCRFKYPRKFCAFTNIESSGYPTYMRRDNGSYVQVNNIRLDNRWIVPYNPFLSLRYQAHINVEICSTITAVKYLYKYVYKGHDRATIVMQDRDGASDEIKRYLDARYVSASEAIWRIYGFDLHDEKPDIQRLQVHLPLQNTITFEDHEDLINVVNNEDNRKTTLTEWFVANQTYPEANDLLYIDFPTKWVYNKSNKRWTHRQTGNSIGRMYNIVPTAGDLYYLRMLLTICKGCMSFEDLRSFNGHLYPTFKEACNARGLLQSDEEWFLCLEEASLHQNAMQLRHLFVIILVFCDPLYPSLLWERFSIEFSDDYSHTLQIRGLDSNVCLNIAKNQALANIENVLKQYDKALSHFPSMPHVDTSTLFLVENTLFAQETMFDVVEQSNVALRMERLLNHGQRNAYDEVVQAAYRNEGRIFFLDGPGGSGKTYLYNALLARIRGNGKVALACASSGIAALLLNNGRTAHQRFKIPLDLNSESTCNIKVNSDHAELLRLATLIVWDEAPMTHRYAFEALDRTLRDIMQEDRLFGGKTMLFGGDFRQVLPVVRKGSREDVVNASLCHSYIWGLTKVLRLTENMRILNCSSDDNERQFAKWVLDIGNGEVHDGNKIDNVFLPNSMLLEGNCIRNLIDSIYADIFRTTNFGSFFRERGILAPRNKDVDAINALAVRNMRGQCKEYYSADSICVEDDQNHLLYTIEYLNSLDLGGGFPPHILYLKENAPIMLLRNLDPKRGLCNGTRLICKQLHHRVIEAEIITGKHAGDVVLLPRIDFVTSTSSGLPFQMRRRQFPVKLAFGMTINKAQGQTIGILGLYLASPVFSHGQLYVALSRVRSFETIKVLVDDRRVELSGANTPNIVFKEVLQVANEANEAY